MAHKHFFNKLLNADDAAHLVDPSELINMLNLRFGTTDKGEAGMIENIKGTTLRYAPETIAPEGDGERTYRCIGAGSDEANRYIVWFIHSPETELPEVDPVWDVIILYDRNTGTSYKVIDSEDVDLNFNPDYLIHSVEIIDGMLYWTNNYNEPRKLNLWACIKGNGGTPPVAEKMQYTFPITTDEIALIKRPCCAAPSIVKDEDVTFENNFIANESFQFAYEYTYYDGEVSVFSPWSASSFLNSLTEEDFNRITVTMPLFEKIPQGVRIVRLIVRWGSTANCFAIKTWDKNDDTTELTAHNAGTALEYEFYNDILGAAIDSAHSIKPFDSVPLLSKALASARSRIFLGNNLEGYNTPQATSLQLGVADVSGGGGSYDAVWGLYTMFFKDYDGSTISSESYAAVYIPSLGTYYLYHTETDPYPSTIDALTADMGGTTDITDMGAWLTNNAGAGTGTDYDYLEDQFDPNAFGAGLPAAVTITNVTPALGVGERSFKSEGVYAGGIVFYDKALRKCGVVTKKELRIETPERTYSQAVFNAGLTWALSNTDAEDEIPDWAYFYAPVLTRNLQTEFFMQARSSQTFYVVKLDDGTYTYTDTTWNEDRYAIGVDISTLVNYGMGYVFKEGDIIKLFFSDDTKQEFSIIGQDGKWLQLQAKDIGTLGATVKPLFEIYSPYKPDETEPYYEVGQMYPVVNATESTRQYSTLNGIFNGDVHIHTRGVTGSEYLTEAMSPNDKFWKRWDTNAGRINIVTSNGQARNRIGIRFSNTIISGTDTNGLSTFEALNQDSLPIEMGELNKLILTSKAKSEGTVMIGIGRSETVSIYLGEGQLSDTAGNVMLIRTVGVIGQVNILEGSLGTLHPESVVMDKGRVFWLDVLNGVVGSYSKGGLFPVSDYKLKRACKLLCNNLLADDVQIPGGIDPYHREYLFSVPETEEAPPKGTLSDYTPEKDYPYDFYDGKAKTWVYKIDQDKFMGAFEFVADYFVSLGEGLFSFKDGTLWEHNSSVDYDSIYGLTVKPALAFVENGEPDSMMKIFTNLALEANMKPSFTHIRTESPYVQSSDLEDGDWNTDEGIYYAEIFRDRLSPNVDGDADLKMKFGDEMRGQWAKIYMEFTTGNDLLQIRFINVLYSQSKGHSNI